MENKYDKGKDFINMFDNILQDIDLTKDQKNLDKTLKNMYNNEENFDIKSKFIKEEVFFENYKETENKQPQNIFIPLRPRQPENAFNNNINPTKPKPIPVPVMPLQNYNEQTNDNEEVMLSQDIYKQTKSLIYTYNQLMDLANREQAEEIARLSTQIEKTIMTAKDIYLKQSNKDLEFNNNIYNKLPNNYCMALRVTFNRLSNLYDDVLSLQRFDIVDIERQLIIMASVLQRQLSTINTLLIDCIL